MGLSLPEKLYYSLTEERIQAPEGVKKLMEELWLNHQSGKRSVSGRIFMVNLPEPTEEDKLIMATNRASSMPVVHDENELLTLLFNKCVSTDV